MAPKPLIDWKEIEEDIEIAEDVAELWELTHPYLESLPGDVSANDIATEKGITMRGARDMMCRIARDYPNQYAMVKVHRDNSGGGLPWQWVIRKGL